MHTVRNRIASRPPITSRALADFKPPVHRSSREELARLLRTGAPSAPAAAAAAPALTLPAVPLTAAAWPTSALAEGGCIAGSMAAPAETRLKKRRNPKGKKARKAAARKAAASAAVSPRKAKATHAKGVGAERRFPAQPSQTPQFTTLPPAPPVSASPAIPPAAPAVHPRDLPERTMPEVESEEMLALCLQAEPALALMLPPRSEPLVEAPEPEPVMRPEFTPPAAAVPQLEPAPELMPEQARARVLTLADLPDLLVAAPDAEPSMAVRAGTSAEPAAEPSAETEIALGTAPALTLPSLPEPLVEAQAALTQAALALATLADAQASPLPRSRALVPARRQGLVDVIAFMLRDSGRRLARWSARRHKSRAEQAALRQAQARQLNLQRELEALEALRRSRG